MKMDWASPPKVVVTTFGVGTADPRYTLEIVDAGIKPLADLLDTLRRYIQ